MIMNILILFFIVTLMANISCIWFLKTKEKEGKGTDAEDFNNFLSVVSTIVHIVSLLSFAVLSLVLICNLTKLTVLSVIVLISSIAFGIIFTYFIRNKIMDLVDNAYYVDEDMYDFIFYYSVIINIINPLGFIIYNIISKILNAILFKNVFYITIQKRKEHNRKKENNK